MITVNIHEAKTHLSKLLQDVMEGQTVVIAKAGVPIVKMIPVGMYKTKRKLGALKGKMKIAQDFDAPLPDDFFDQSAAEGKS